MVIYMDKILSFIVNKDNQFLLLKTNPNDLKFKKSFWYVITGGCEIEDKNLIDTVIREIKEETGISKLNKVIYLNWILKYTSLNLKCTEYVYISFVNESLITLNEENIDYMWCNIDDFIKNIHWFGNKKELQNVLEMALRNVLYFKEENVQILE